MQISGAVDPLSPSDERRTSSSSHASIAQALNEALTSVLAQIPEREKLLVEDLSKQFERKAEEFEGKRSQQLAKRARKLSISESDETEGEPRECTRAPVKRSLLKQFKDIENK